MRGLLESGTPGATVVVRQQMWSRRAAELLPRMEFAVRQAGQWVVCARSPSAEGTGGGSDDWRALCPLAAVERDASELLCTRPGCVALPADAGPRLRCRGCGLARYCWWVKGAWDRAGAWGGGKSGQGTFWSGPTDARGSYNAFCCKLCHRAQLMQPALCTLQRRPWPGRLAAAPAALQGTEAAAGRGSGGAAGGTTESDRVPRRRCWLSWRHGMEVGVCV